MGKRQKPLILAVALVALVSAWVTVWLVCSPLSRAAETKGADGPYVTETIETWVMAPHRILQPRADPYPGQRLPAAIVMTPTSQPGLRTTYLPLLLKDMSGAMPTPTPTPGGVNHYEPSINVVFDVHIEPLPQVPLSQRHDMYLARRDQVLWLREMAAIYGVRLSLQSNGEYIEFCLEDGHCGEDPPSGDFVDYLNDGHDVGTHWHKSFHASPHNWPEVPNLDPETAERIVTDNKAMVDRVIGPENNRAGNGQVGYPGLYADQGFTIAPGTGEQGAYYIGHLVWNPWRPGVGPGLPEDLSNTQYVAVPHLPQIGKAEYHGPPEWRWFADLRLDNLKRRFLMAFLEWREHERLGQDDKVWVWGVATHPQVTGQVRDQITAFFAWLNENFIGQATPRGTTIARYATVRDVYEEFLAWEGANPGVSSFHWEPGDPYPYSLPGMVEALQDAEYEEAITTWQAVGVAAHRLSRAGTPVYVLYSDQGKQIVDFSSQEPGLLRVTDGQGATELVDSTALTVTEAPIFVTPLTETLPYEDSPFGFHPADVPGPDPFAEAQNMGIRWHRPGLYAFWFLVQPDLNNPTYDWTPLDRQYGAVPAGINILANVDVEPLVPQGRRRPGSWLPVDQAAYTAFVRAAVERYDGDGVDDMPGLTVPIRYWQVSNEPLNFLADFPELQRITYAAIKDACSECQVLIGGVPGMPDGYVERFDQRYASHLEALAGKYVDIFDLHWYGDASGDYRRLGQALAGIQAKLDETGFSDIPIWITEMGTYSGDPADDWSGTWPYQSEAQQAGDLLKRFVYPLSLGVEKIFPAFGLMEGFKHDDGYFDHTGLIYDGQGSDDRGLGVKKLGYYTYRLMAEKLGGSDWGNVETVVDGVENVYAYRFSREGRSVYVVWWDTFTEPDYSPGDTRTITLSVDFTGQALVTRAVPDAESGADLNEGDYPAFFSQERLSVVNGQVTLTLGQSPIFVEAAPPIHWVWLEAEEFASSNFPYASHATRGPFCAACSGREYLLFLPGRKGRPFDPPGYWYADYALRVPAPGDYRHVWMALWPMDAPFSWTVDGQPSIPATVLELGPTYGSDPTFRWVRLDPTGLDLNLDPQGNPHTLRLRRDDPDSPRMQMDAIVLTTDPAWTPSGIEKPSVDRSYLDPYPDYVLYARSWLEHILPDTIPEPDEITTLSAFAAPSEYEPLTFALYARRPLTDVVVSVSDLTLSSPEIGVQGVSLRGAQRRLSRAKSRGSKPLRRLQLKAGDCFASLAMTNPCDSPGRLPPELPRVPSSPLASSVVISATEIDLRVVRVVTRRRDNHSSPEETELVPEILDYNTPQDIPADSSRQYWLTIHVPPDAVAGTYEGVITVAPANAPTRALTLTLEVLPFALQTPPDRAFSMGYRPLREFDGVPLPGDPSTYLRQDHQDIRAHGMNSGMVYTPVGVSLEEDGTVQVDYSDLIRHMDLLGELGFTGPAHWRGISRLPRDLQHLGVVTDTLEAVYTDVVSTVLRLREERGWPEVYFYPVDEPFGDPEKEAEFYWLAPLIKQVPGALVEVSLDGAEVLPPEADPFTDVRFYSGWSVDRWLPIHTFQEIAADAAASGDRLGFYYNTRRMGGRPEFSRATWGFYAWNSP
ncbi:MAG: hypothetical protein ACE5MB_09130, partial [Anaerolineae bacterium]